MQVQVRQKFLSNAGRLIRVERVLSESATSTDRNYVEVSDVRFNPSKNCYLKVPNSTRAIQVDSIRRNYQLVG